MSDVPHSKSKIQSITYLQLIRFLVIITISCVILYTLGIIIAWMNPVAGYEMDVYSATPAIFWVSIIVCMILGSLLYLALYKGITPLSKVLKHSGLSLLILASFALSNVGLIRGYFSISLNDDSGTHLANLITTVNSGFIPSSNYPGAYGELAVTSVFTSLSEFDIIYYVPSVMLILYIFFAVVFCRLVLGDAKYSLIIALLLPLGSAVGLSSGIKQFTPMQYSLIVLILIMVMAGILFTRRNVKKGPLFIIIAISSLVLPFLHPLLLLPYSLYFLAYVIYYICNASVRNRRSLSALIVFGFAVLVSSISLLISLGGEVLGILKKIGTSRVVTQNDVSGSTIDTAISSGIGASGTTVSNAVSGSIIDTTISSDMASSGSLVLDEISGGIIDTLISLLTEISDAVVKNEIAKEMIDTAISALSYGYSPVDFVLMALVPTTLYCLIPVAVLLYIIYVRKNPQRNCLFEISILFLVFILASTLWLIVTSVLELNINRFFMLISVIAFVSFGYIFQTLPSFFGKYKRQITYSLLIMAVVFFAMVSVPLYYGSPLSQTMATHNSPHGYYAVAETTIPSLNRACDVGYPGFSLERYRQILSPSEPKLSLEGDNIPYHFGYDIGESFSDSLSKNTYVYVTKYLRSYYVDFRPSLEKYRYTQTDFGRLDYDNGVSLLYQNGEVDLYYISI